MGKRRVGEDTLLCCVSVHQSVLVSGSDLYVVNNALTSGAQDVAHASDDFFSQIETLIQRVGIQLPPVSTTPHHKPVHLSLLPCLSVHPDPTNAVLVRRAAWR